MAKRKKAYYVRIQKGKRRNKVLTKSNTDIKHDPNEKQYLDCPTTEQKMEVVKQEQIEVTIKSSDDDKKDNDESRSATLFETQINKKIDVIKQEQIEITIERVDDDKKDDDESGSDTFRQVLVNEDLWVVRRQLCRGCHSDGAFWSLQTTTEGDTYGDLLQTYFNIQLCPVSKDEHALSAICASCASRLREARAFSAQARAAEERFTRSYKQNRIIALVNELDIKKEVPEIKKEVDDLERTDDVEPETVNSNLVDDLETTDDVEPETANSNLVDDLETADDVEPETPKSNLGKPELKLDESGPTLNKNKRTQARRDKPALKKLYRLSPSECERIGKLLKRTRCDELYKRSGIQDQVKKNVQLQPHKYTCPHCDKTFMNLGEFRCHKLDEHSISHGNSKQDYKIAASDFERVGASYKCNRCEKQFDYYKQVRIHVRHTHLKVPWKKYTCPYCDDTFHNIGPFTQHKLEKHSVDDRIKCNACDWSTNRNSELNKHKQSFHMLGEKRTCPDCDYSCFNEGAMKKHSVKHSTVKEHHCKYCKKSFLRRSNLITHERIHTGDKRKVCNVCGQAFVQRASLTYHMAKHHPEVRL